MFDMFCWIFAASPLGWQPEMFVCEGCVCVRAQLIIMFAINRLPVSLLWCIQKLQQTKAMNKQLFSYGRHLIHGEWMRNVFLRFSHFGSIGIHAFHMHFLIIGNKLKGLEYVVQNYVPIVIRWKCKILIHLSKENMKRSFRDHVLFLHLCSILMFITFQDRTVDRVKYLHRPRQTRGLNTCV